MDQDDGSDDRLVELEMSAAKPDWLSRQSIAPPEPSSAIQYLVPLVTENDGSETVFHAPAVSDESVADASRVPGPPLSL